MADPAVTSPTGTIPKRRTCPNCHHTMSSIDRDPHKFCLNCREVDCTLDNRCDFCRSLSVEQMKSYLKYQVKLQRDRDRKKKLRDDSASQDFSVLCTRGGGSMVSGVGDSGSDGLGDSASVAGSSNSFAILSSQIANLRTEWSSQIESVYHDMDDRVASAVSKSISPLINLLSSTAPHQVPGNLSSGLGQIATPPSNPPYGKGQVAARDGRVPGGKPSPPPNIASRRDDLIATIRAFRALGQDVPDSINRAYVALEVDVPRDPLPKDDVVVGARGGSEDHTLVTGVGVQGSGDGAGPSGVPRPSKKPKGDIPLKGGVPGKGAGKPKDDEVHNLSFLD